MSDIIHTLRADLIALLKAGLISEAQMRQFDTMWPAPSGTPVLAPLV